VNRDAKRFTVSSPAARIMALTGALLAVAMGVLVRDEADFAKGRRDAVRQFQRMAGGLGLGATVCPRWCFVNFDPRLEHCTCAEQPLPGGYCYCPEHTGTVSFFALDRSNVIRVDEQGFSGP